jgi:outer membrane protein
MKKLLISLAMTALATPIFAQSPPARIAVVDVNKVLMSSAPGKAAFEKLKKMQDDRIAKAQVMNEEITKLDADIKARKLSLSEDKLADMTKQLTDKKIAVQHFAQDADVEVSDARDKALGELENKIKPVIDTISKEMGLAAVFNKFESGLVYASDAIDITDTVMKRFGAIDAAAAPAKKP